MISLSHGDLDSSDFGGDRGFHLDFVVGEENFMIEENFFASSEEHNNWMEKKICKLIYNFSQKVFLIQAWVGIMEEI